MNTNPLLRVRFRRFVYAFFLFTFLLSTALGQAPSGARVKNETPKVNRANGLEILRQLKNLLDDKYYDESISGDDVKASFAAAEERIKTLDRMSDINRTIANVLVGLGDSHTIFYPPPLLYRVQYGFSMMMIGDGCFVATINENSDAVAKGLKLGDRILEFNGNVPTRRNLWMIEYIIYSLEPQEEIRLKVAGADKKEREITFQAKFISPDERKKELKKLRADEQSKPYTCVAIGADITACKFRTFEVEKNVVDKMMKEVLTRKKLILDLRGNPGGYLDTQIHFTGWFFDREVKIGTEKTRKKAKDVVAKGRSDSFKGELIVLTDSDSASAAELFARVVQIEKRGKVVGDTSAGAVMASIPYGIATDTRVAASINDVNIPYRVSVVSVSVADFVMSDGSRLEGIGVLPDVSVGPTQQAMLDRNDPVLSYAAELLGTPITPQEAGKFYFLIPKPEAVSDKGLTEASGK